MGHWVPPFLVSSFVSLQPGPSGELWAQYVKLFSFLLNSRGDLVQFGGENPTTHLQTPGTVRLTKTPLGKSSCVPLVLRYLVGT